MLFFYCMDTLQLSFQAEEHDEYTSFFGGMLVAFKLTKVKCGWNFAGFGVLCC